MAGIYIHIPFCKQACYYCNFHFATSLRNKTELINALIKEIDLQKSYLNNETVETIYFGGGTPSLLAAEELSAITRKISSVFFVSQDAEITLEANPDDITEEKLISWEQTGINRLSIGIQSFFDEDLQWMNRAHNAQQAIDNLQLAKKHFDNITIDLIYGTPQLTNEKWKRNVDMAIALNIPHLSCYALTVEPKTPLHKMIQQHKSDDINPDKQSEQFLLLMQWLEEAGYEHYEISNFSKPGWRSRHNSSYWKGKEYLGLGPSAHSYNGESRCWNIANNNLYIESINKGVIPFDEEVLTATQKLNEYIMTSLRTMEGINLKILLSQFGIGENEIMNKAKKFIAPGLIQSGNTSITLTREGKLLADGIAAELFF
ncbi:MAG: radical SAM family heme chaperone HemW [Chitinophagaceae bacterium]|nr:radical SAM family heme chaperone HemW [Chitinophagaceae bacterium]